MIEFPDSFPKPEHMYEILRKTIEKAWKVDFCVSAIDDWLANFSGKVFDIHDEKRLALWLLCNYTYYSPVEVNHLCRILYNYLLHDIIVQDSLSVSQLEETIKKTCFSSIGSASESGGLLLYHFRQEANLSIDRFFYPTEIKSDMETIVVFIDDATLSGGTGERHFYNLIQRLQYKRVYYLTIIASEQAITKLQEHGIHVISCSIVNNRNRCFSEDSMIFYRYPSIRDYAKKMAEEYGKTILRPKSKAKPLGYDDGQYCFGFYYNTPNNTLPIFWSDYNWKPIFHRKEKLQNAKQQCFIASRYI